MEHKTSEKQTILMANTNKTKQNPKQNFSEYDSENDATQFSKFIILESFKETCLAKLSPFLMEKYHLSQSKPSNCEKDKQQSTLGSGQQKNMTKT